MQRFIQDGLILTGHLAIFDSIKDMIVALFGCMCFLLVMLIQKEKPLLSKGQ